MLSLQSRVWDIQNIFTNESADDFRKGLNIGRISSKLLMSRNYSDIENAAELINTDEGSFFDPFLLPDMEKAARFILEMINNKKKILIYGDYDVDGITSTSVLYLFLKKYSENIEFYIPDRIEDGYGLSVSAIDYLKKNIKPDLIITVDCGAVSFYEAEYIKELGISLIITDHHECTSEMPAAVAVINPNRYDSKYPNSNLAGVGVALKLVQAIGSLKGNENDFMNYVDLAALGTVSDLAELTGENRLIVIHGLKKINSEPGTGLKQLIKVSGLKDRDIKSWHIGFIIGPRINAAGRLENASKAVDLFATESDVEAFEIATELDRNNQKRQDCQRGILEKAILEIEKNKLYDDRVIVVYGREWHQGVIGIVASKITEKYYKPALVITDDGDSAKGSGRSIESFNLYESLKHCENLFHKFGGHEMAAGFSLEEKNIDKLRKRINEFADKNYTDDIFIPGQKIDTLLEIDDISVDAIEELRIIEPFGIGNPVPVFCLSGLRISNMSKMGKAKDHIKLSLMKNSYCIEAVGFGMGELSDKLRIGDNIDVAFSLSVNEWQNTKSAQLIIKDIRKIDNSDSVSDIKNSFLLKNRKKVDLIIKNVDNIDSTVKKLSEINFDKGFIRADRETLIKLYKYIRTGYKENKAINILKIIMKEGNEINYLNAVYGLEIFKELGIVDYEEKEDGNYLIRSLIEDRKQELEDSGLYKKLNSL